VTTAAAIKAAEAEEESFWIKGTAYRGFRGDWARSRAPYNITKVTSMWAAMNGNGIYNLQDPAFYEFMDRVWEAYPYDGAIHAYLFDVDNFEYTKRALTKIRYSSHVQNHGATRFDIEKLRRESPETYIVHSSCRAEFPNKEAYCFVCDKDTPWSEECQIKLSSLDNLLGYDRYDDGPYLSWPGDLQRQRERDVEEKRRVVICICAFSRVLVCSSTIASDYLCTCSTTPFELPSFHNP
jgi:hypothetical protein